MRSAMRNRRYQILAGTALTLILAAPLVGMAKNNSQITAAAAIEQAFSDIAAATAAPANEAPATVTAATSNVATPDATPAIEETAKPAASVEQTAAPDPLASLDPADRAVAEHIRDLLT